MDQSGPEDKLRVLFKQKPDPLEMPDLQPNLLLSVQAAKEPDEQTLSTQPSLYDSRQSPYRRVLRHLLQTDSSDWRWILL